MANDILLAGIGDLTTSEVVNAQYLLLLAERSPIIDHPALINVGSIDGRGSNVIKVPHLGLMGYDVLAATADGSSVANSALTDGSTTVTVTRHSKAYEASDLARMVAGEMLDPVVFALDAAASAANRITDLLCNVIDGFASHVGTTTVDCDVATFLGGIGAARVGNAEGSLMAILHGQQWRDIMVDAGTAVGGSIQMQQATADVMQMMGSGYQGRWLGADCWVNNRVVTANAGADRAGAIFGRGAVLWGYGTPPMDDPSRQMLVAAPGLGVPVLYERDRTGRAGESAMISHMYHGVSLALEAGVSVITDA